MKTAPKIFIILGAVAVAVAVVVIVARPLLARKDAVRYITRPVAYADITSTVSETGTLNPVNTVSVGSEVSGIIQTLGADFNSHVKKNQVLVTLDPTDYQAAVSSATASLQLAEANLNSANVNVAKMKALLDMADLTLGRDTDLFNQGLINKSQVDADTTARITAYQDTLASQASVQVANAQVAVARGNLDQARHNLTKTVIRSPLDGIVLARNVSVGQTVAASLSAPTLFSLATSLADMQVDTSVDEADAGRVKQGASARFTVTAFPNETFQGTVTQVRVNPTVTQNVVTYDAVVAVHDISGRLLPGMTAQVTIDVGKRTHVPAVPLAGVLYRPLAPTAGGGGAGGFGGGFFGPPGGGGGTTQAVAGAPGSQITLWVLENGRPVARRVVIGLSDSTNVEITSGPLNAGDPVIVAQRRGGSSAGSGFAVGANGSPGSAAAASGAGGSGSAVAPNNGAAGAATGSAPSSAQNASAAPNAAPAAAGAISGKGSTRGARTGTRPRSGVVPTAPGSVATDPPSASAPVAAQEQTP